MRQAVLNLEESKIREVANAGMDRADMLPFWFGESDEVTPAAIRDAGIASLQAGETFYSHNLGLPELRQAVSAYASRLHGDVALDRLAITSGGVNALIVAMQALIDAGDEVVAVTPVWPNLTAQPVILGARLTCVALQPDAEGAWRLDLPALLAAITPRTKLLVVNSPNNPTGWTLSKDEQTAILTRCRQTGTWILSDEVYERLYFRGDTANGAALVCTPGTACSSGTSVSRQVFRCATMRGVMDSVCCSATSAARCTNTGAHEVLNSSSLPTCGVMSGGITRYPKRQPVIRKALEKLCTTTSRSSGSATSRKLGAAPLAVSPRK